MIAGGPGKIVTNLETGLTSIDRREWIGSYKSDPGDLMRDARHLGIELGKTASKVNVRLVHHVVGKNARKRESGGRVLYILNSGSGIIVLTQRLVLRFVLNSRDLARVVPEPERQLVPGLDQVIES